MLARLLLALLLLTGASVAHAQMPPNVRAVILAKKSPVAAAPAVYLGPGNISGLGSPTVWGGLRGFNTADVANAANVCLPSDTVCADLTLSSGNVVVPGSLSTCNITTVICTMKTIYDKSGNGLDIAMATEATRPTFRPAMASNGCPTTAKPCMKWALGQLMKTNSTSVGLTQPYSVAFAVSSYGSSRYWAVPGGTNLIVDRDTTNSIRLNFGSAVTATMSDNTYHSAVTIGNGAAGNACIDSTSNVLNAGTANGFNAFFYGDHSFFSGSEMYSMEIGVWPIAFTVSGGGQCAQIDAQMRTYWGY